MAALQTLIPDGGVDWDSNFGKRRSLDATSVGKPYIDLKAECRAASGEDLATTQAADVVSMFMRDDESVNVSAEADKVEAFFSSVSRQSLLTDFWQANPCQAPVALVDERSLDGAVLNRIHTQGPLTAEKLYQALRQSRVRAGDSQPSTDDAALPYVQRRRTFISDPDRWSTCALIGTVPRHQKTAMRSMLYWHLQFRPRINVNIPSEGRRFEFAFHLPCAAMRDSLRPRIDTRRSGKGSRLRGYQDASCLNLECSGLTTYRYEAVTSFMIVGTDDATWDAYCLDDSYFDPIQEGKRWVEFYDESRQFAEGTGVAVNPCTRGKVEFGCETSNPRQYFLLVLSEWLDHLRAEYERIVDRVNDSIRGYRRSEHEMPNMSNSCQRGQKIRGLNIIEWITKVKQLSNTSLMELSSVVGVIQAFFSSSHIALFQTDPCKPSVLNISSILDDLLQLKKTLETDVKWCDDLMREQEIRLSQESIRLSHESTEGGRKSQFISKFILPVGIVEAMFAMPENVLPFKVNTTTFAGMVLVIGALISFGYDPLWYWQGALTVAGKAGSKETFRALYLEFREFWRTTRANSTPHDQSEGSGLSVTEV